MAYELLLEQPWHDRSQVDLERWVTAYATRRAGCADPAVIDAWTLLNKNVFLDGVHGIPNEGSIIEARPLFDSKVNAPVGASGSVQEAPAPSLPYKQSDLVAAIDELFKASPEAQAADGYRFDAVNLVRQAIANDADVLNARMMAAYKRSDLADFRRQSARFLDLIRDMDTLVGTRHEFLLGVWIQDARAWAATPAEAAYYEGDARQIITTWHKPGGTLTDYAHREWNGLLGTFYLPRWKEFVKRLDVSLAANKPFDFSEFNKWCIAFEQGWLDSTGGNFAVTPKGDAVATARRIFAKYRDELVPSPTVVKLDKLD